MKHWRFAKHTMTGLAVPRSDAVLRRCAATYRSFTAVLLALFVVAIDAPQPASAHLHTFLYYAGRAAQFDGERYLVPVAEPSISTDTDLDSAEYIMPGCRQFLIGNTQFHFLEGNCNGIVETLEFMSPDLCVPPGSTLGEAVRIVVQYIDARPIRLQENFRLLALEALASAWPCGASK